MVDIKDPKGEDTFAYIADTAAYKLVVYDLKNDDSWVIDQAYFYPYPTAANFDVNGVKFNFMDGVLGLALSECRPGVRIYRVRWARTCLKYLAVMILILGTIRVKIIIFYIARGKYENKILYSNV